MVHSILDLVREAMARHGYWVVGLTLLLENAGLPVPGESVLLFASFLAYSRHELQMPWIVLVAIAAATFGDNLGFFIGDRGGHFFLARYQIALRIPQATISFLAEPRLKRLIAVSVSSRNTAQPRFSSPAFFLVCESSPDRSPGYCACPGNDSRCLTPWAPRCGSW